jgi:hypothetical protein
MHRPGDLAQAGRFGFGREIWLWPGDLALAGRFGYGREIWLWLGDLARPGDLAQWPGDLALARRFGSGREIWLSPVIQATWEARAVGWFEVDRPQQENRRVFGSALWLPTSG